MNLSEQDERDLFVLSEFLARHHGVSINQQRGEPQYTEAERQSRLHDLLIEKPSVVLQLWGRFFLLEHLSYFETGRFLGNEEVIFLVI